MCGRYTLRHSISEIAERFAVDEVRLPEALQKPRFNIAPTQWVPAILDVDQGGEAADARPPRRVLTSLRWGLLPSWARDASLASKLINARAETLADKPAFRAALRQRRCLIPADGFYEWQAAGRVRQPHFIHLRRKLREGELFAFAGLWEEWQPPGPGAELLRTCTVITVPPNALMQTLHDRMPAILRPQDEEPWLAPASREAEALALLHPYEDGALEATAVSRRVNSVAADDPQCLAPAEVEGDEAGGNLSFDFERSSK